MIASHEIKDGIVLYLDPDELEAEGGVSTGTDRGRVEGAHFFVCIAANESVGNWVPLFGDAAPYRELVPYHEKTGSRAWRESTAYFHEKEVWQAPHAAVVAASIAAGDPSQPGERNALTPEGVDLVYDTVFPPSSV